MVASLRSKDANAESIIVVKSLHSAKQAQNQKEQKEKALTTTAPEPRVRNVYSTWKSPMLVIGGLKWHESILKAEEEAQNAEDTSQALRVSPRKKRKLDSLEPPSDMSVAEAATTKSEQTPPRKHTIATSRSSGRLRSSTMASDDSTPGDSIVVASPRPREPAPRPTPTLPTAEPSPKPSPAPSPPKASPEPPATPKDPDDLLPTDLLPAFLPSPTFPPPLTSFEDTAAFILATTYRALPPAQDFLTPLTSHPPSTRTTTTLYTLAQNTFQALRAWQDEYLALDRKLLPLLHSHAAQNPSASIPLRKPATGGRAPQTQKAWDDQKAADMAPILGGRGAGGTNAGRELRTRRRAPRRLEAENVAAPSEDDAVGAGRRTRRPARRFDVEVNGSGREGSAPEARRGGGGGASAGVRGARRVPARSLAPAASFTGDETGPAESGQESRHADETTQGSETPSEEEVEGEDDDTFGGRRGGGRTSAGRGRAGVARGGAAASAAGAAAGQRKPRVKSEKRAESMTLWWAERKRKQAEARNRELRLGGGEEAARGRGADGRVATG